MKLEITKEKVIKAADKCSTAKEVLKELFPEAFEEQYSPWQIILMDDGDDLNIIKRLEKSDRFGLFSLSCAMDHWIDDKSFGSFDHCIEYAKNLGKIHAFDNEEDFRKFMKEYYS